MTTKTAKKSSKDGGRKTLRIGVVVPHIFMHGKILPDVIFSPGKLALNLSDGLTRLNQKVTLFTPGPVQTAAKNITADLSYFETELAGRDDTYIDLLKKHPFTFVTLARQVQSELIAKAFGMANDGQLDIVHVYTNEEDTALPFAKLCQVPVVFTHHDPFNFLVKYKNVFPKYPELNWVSMSLGQRSGMPKGTNWVGNVYHGLDKDTFSPNYSPSGDYIAYMGRIVEPKGLHLAIKAVKLYNQRHNGQLKLKIAGKHYAGHSKDSYWKKTIEPLIDGHEIEYLGFISDDGARHKFLSNASALIMPSTFEEPFGMVMIESLACGTPIIGLDSGAVPEVIKAGVTGFVARKVTGVTANTKTGKPKTVLNTSKTAFNLASALQKIDSIDRHDCRQDFDTRFTLDRMCKEHLKIYRALHNH